MKKLVKSSSQPMHLQLKELIREKIAKGEYKIGDKIPTTSELCRNYEVSLTTVRRAILDLIAEGLLKGAPGKGTFVLARERPTQRRQTKLVGVIFTDVISNPFFLTLFQGVSDWVSARGYHLVVSASNNSPEKEARLLQELVEKGVEGFIVAPALLNRTHSADHALREIIATGLPVVFVDRKLEGFQVDYVTSDNRAGARAATQYLLDLGHRRIAFVKSIEANTVQERLEGYRGAIEASGGSFDPLLVKRFHVELENEESGFANTMELLHMAEPPTAIFACNDVLALGVYRACYELGLSIPRDVSVVGYDDATFGASLIPPLTTVRQPIYEMGIRAGDLLMGRILGEERDATEIVLQSRLVERGSCAAVKKTRARK